MQAQTATTVAEIVRHHHPKHHPTVLLHAHNTASTTKTASMALAVAKAKEAVGQFGAAFHGLKADGVPLILAVVALVCVLLFMRPKSR